MTVPVPDAERRRYSISDDEVTELARYAVAIEQHYGRPMDMEWAKDGPNGDIFIVQARPETVQSRREVGAFRSYRITKKGPLLVSGLSIGDAVVAGKVCLIQRGTIDFATKVTNCESSGGVGAVI